MGSRSSSGRRPEEGEGEREDLLVPHTNLMIMTRENADYPKDRSSSGKETKPRERCLQGGRSLPVDEKNMGGLGVMLSSSADPNLAFEFRTCQLV